MRKELARPIGVSETTVVNWEKDRAKPGRKHISKFANFFGVKDKALLQLIK